MYLNDPSLAVDIFSNNGADSSPYGMFMESGNTDILREGDMEEKKYLYGLLWIDKDGKSNENEFRMVGKNLGYNSGDIICQYLVSTKEAGHEYCDFFKAWLKVRDKNLSPFKVAILAAFLFYRYKFLSRGEAKNLYRLPERKGTCSHYRLDMWLINNGSLPH
ncbi:hypothetical protein DFP94_1011251 [Fontibacillus phaseoli]|uniref:Uncharacterized protein n=1 Tax=Fontibacillus phaseoli TaxID=1416533 RepID=A0A369BPU5_9BACL|nr:hypothetical protein [Fontibacillus phaseoli]RCX23649.1 hypothetical protein DFP94_1011251 [Fontibacillus phaseoli]